jgi:hypothetical protein
MAQSKSPPLPRFSGLFDPKFDIALNLRPAFYFQQRLRATSKSFLELTEVKRLIVNTSHHTNCDYISYLLFLNNFRSQQNKLKTSIRNL